MPSEAQARITINRLLEAAGWRFLPDKAGQREAVCALNPRNEAKIQRVLARVWGTEA